MQDRILAAAVEEALAVGWATMTRRGVADRAGVATGSVNHSFGTMAALREEVMRVAVRDGHDRLILQGIAAGSAIALDAPKGLKQKAMRAAA